MNDVNRTIARNRKMMVERSERSQKTPEREKNGLYSQEKSRNANQPYGTTTRISKPRATSTVEQQGIPKRWPAALTAPTPGVHVTHL
jgi:hypothetical protein